MPGTRDLINELIDSIESQKFNYVIGIIKPIKDKPLSQDIDIYTNTNENALDKLLFVLQEHNASKTVSTTKKPRKTSKPKDTKE